MRDFLFHSTWGYKCCLLGRVLAWHAQSLGSIPSIPSMMMHTRNPRIQQMEVGGLEVQDHPWLHSSIWVTSDTVSKQTTPTNTHARAHTHKHIQEIHFIQCLWYVNAIIPSMFNLPSVWPLGTHSGFHVPLTCPHHSGSLPVFWKQRFWNLILASVCPFFMKFGQIPLFKHPIELTEHSHLPCSVLAVIFLSVHRIELKD